MILSGLYGKWRWTISQFAEKRWWNAYLKNKDQREYLTWKKNYWVNFLEKIELKIPPEAYILDAGSGPAGIFTILDENRVVAIDTLMNDYQKRNYLLPQNYANVEFINGSLENFVNEKPFDFIFCINAINHVRDIRKSLHHLNMNLTSYGIIVFSTDAHKNKVLKKLFQCFPGDILHPHQYSITDYENILEEENFTITKKIVLKSGTIFDYCVFIAGKKH